MESRKKSRAELEDALKRQMANLRRSAIAFDGGAYEEGERLASAAYILCHEGQTSKSLLKSLGLRSKTTYPDTGRGRDAKPWQITHAGPPLLCMVKHSDGIEVRPQLDLSTITAELPFHKWWNQYVYTNIDRRQLSRNGLVFGLRSQDGGAHVDRKIRDEDYYRFSRKHDHLTWSGCGNFAMRDGLNRENDHLFTMRQIIWELETAMIRLGY